MVFALMAQLDSALAYEARGSGFESRSGHVAAAMLSDGQAEDRWLRPALNTGAPRGAVGPTPILPAKRPGIGRGNKSLCPAVDLTAVNGSIGQMDAD